MASFSKEALRKTLGEGLGQVRLVPQVARAFDLAFSAHQGQFRDQADSASKKVPYIVHPVGVALIAQQLLPMVDLDETFEDVISACLTHDVLEDSDVSPTELAKATSARTSEIVTALTKPLVTNGTNHNARNAIFLRQIIAAGKLAMFVKICDHCHNISRPSTTPLGLLDKALKKGRQDYLGEFFEPQRLPQSLKAEYERRLEIAHKAMDELRLTARAEVEAWSLEKAIEYCVGKSDKKVIELHDIVEIITTITNAAFIRIEAPAAFLAREIFEKHRAIDQRLRNKLERAVEDGVLDLASLPSEIKEGIVVQADRVFAIELSQQARPNPLDKVLVGIRRNSASDWIGASTLQMLVGYLCERLGAQKRNRLSALAADLAKYRLEIDLEEVERLGISRPELQHLRALIDHAEFLRKRLMLSLEYELLGKGSRSDLPFVTSRVKSPQSLVRKMISRRLPKISDVEDSLGFRVVCRSRSQVRVLELRVRNLILRECFPSIAPNAASDAVRSNHSESSAGYNALHLYFSVPLSGAGEVRLGCEIQIRTAFQDAWARVSHDLSYKNEGGVTESTVAILIQLGDLRDKADGIVDEAE